ncbi:MAG: type I restriction enzyme HsdR N-terminal domain-containing protein [Bacteroidales bacterium]|nr:type I restriction enzyme HsdR N-terminal domain-containing protein [Bacteroidales bacterium]
MQPLGFPEYSFRIRESSGRDEIFDETRKKFVALTPEEWVRQHFIRYLITEKAVPVSHIVVEASFKLFGLVKRSDIVVSDRKGEPVLLVECKAPHVNITQQTFDQIARYNMALKVKYLVVTNGLNHYCCIIDHTAGSYRFMEEIPAYLSLAGLKGQSKG